MKHALMSPYLTYYEVMPAKPGKDFVMYTLSKVLISLHNELPRQSVPEELLQPPVKRQKTQQYDYHGLTNQMIKYLAKSGVLSIGLNKVQKALIDASTDENEKRKYVVFIVNDQETAEMNKHVIGFCRQFGFHNYLLPKFLKKNCCDLMGTKRLTCFAIKIENEKTRNEQVLNQLKEFDNHTENREDIDDFKYAEESIFKPCLIRRWQVDINPRKK